MMFPDSGLVVGPSHSDGGVYASVANGPDVELEGGEFIINKEATEDFLPLIKQINDIGRMEQMNDADNAQNAHSAIDALIASASTKMMPGGGIVAPKTPMYQEGGPLHSRRMFNQGTGFDKKKSDLNKDGKISEYEKKRGMAIAKSMKNQMQMGGMIGMQQPMMQRPMNPAMNLSPMQRMGNDMPPMMYQEGGAVADKTRVELPAQIVLDNLARRIGSSSDIQTPNDLVRYLTTVRPAFEVSSPKDNENIENFFKMLESIDAVPKSRKSMQMGGQVQLRKQAEMRKEPKEKMNVIFPFINEMPFLYPNFQGPLSPSQSESLNEFLKQLEEEKEKQPKKLMAQEGGMISDNNLMGAMANDRRVAALQPDVYSSKMENGMTVEQKMMVPKLVEAILPVYGVETPLSRRQSSMLKKNAVSPSALNPNLKGLVNRLLVQRLANETT